MPILWWIENIQANFCVLFMEQPKQLCSPIILCGERRHSSTKDSSFFDLWISL